MEIMSERNEVTRKISEIRDEIKNIKSLRKAVVKLLSMIDYSVHAYISLTGKYDNSIWYEDFNVYNGYRKDSYCFVCKVKEKYLSSNWIYFNDIITLRYAQCEKCWRVRYGAKLCPTCLRETSRCSLIHTRKLLCYKFLLSQKFPKDIIRLIVQKVK